MAKGTRGSWASLRNRLGNWRRITITLPAPDRRTGAIRTDTHPDAEPLEVARARALPFDGTRKRSWINP